MKKYTLYKTVQLLFFILIAVGLIAWIFPVTSVYHEIAHNTTLKLLAGSIWFVLLGSFVFILLDYVYFFGYLKDYKEMDVAIRSDPVSGIANRFSCDVIIEKYLNQPLPRNLGCMMIDISNIQEINKKHGHIQGNLAIKDFSHMLSLSCIGLCFVGRNGGNKFLAIFEDSSPDVMDTFIDRVKVRVDTHNNDPKNAPIEFKYGTSYSNLDHVSDITELISLANSRIAYDECEAAEDFAEESNVSEAVVDNSLEETSFDVVDNEPVKAIEADETQPVVETPEAVIEQTVPVVEAVAEEAVAPVVEAVAEPIEEVHEELAPVVEEAVLEPAVNADNELRFETISDDEIISEPVVEAVAEEAVAPVVEAVAETAEEIHEKFAPVVEEAVLEPAVNADNELSFETISDNEVISEPVVETVAEEAEEIHKEFAPVVEEAVLEPVVNADNELRFETISDDEVISEPVVEAVAEEAVAPVVEAVAEAAEEIHEEFAPVVEEAVLEPAVNADNELRFETISNNEVISEPVVETVAEEAEEIHKEFAPVVEAVAESVEEAHEEIAPIIEDYKEPIEWVKVDNPVIEDSFAPVSEINPQVSSEDKFASLIKALEEINSNVENNTEEIAEAVIEDNAEDFVEAVIEDKAEDIAEAVIEDNAEDIAEAVIEDNAEDFVEAVIEDKAEDIAEAVIEDNAEDIAEAVIEDNAEDFVEAVIEDKAEDIAEAVIEDNAEEIVEAAIEDKVEKIVESIAEKIDEITESPAADYIAVSEAEFVSFLQNYYHEEPKAAVLSAAESGWYKF